MSRGEHAMINGTLAGAGRNGMPDTKRYVYRGSRPLADEMPHQCAGECGRRTTRADELCAVCRGTWDHEDTRRAG